MRTDLFDFAMPERAIALVPSEPRDAARMLCVGQGGAMADRIVRDLADMLRPGDVLVLNDTRVIRAALSGRRRRGDVHATIEATLIERLGEDRWRALARPAKRLSIGDVIEFASGENASALHAEVFARGEGGAVDLHFDRVGVLLDRAIEAVGAMPLPPYIASRRPAEAADSARYQTVYARTAGAVAAPTAGLHLTDDLMARLATRGVEHHFVTLHVGAGTFLPVKADDTQHHVMHAEWGEITEATAAAINAARSKGGRVVAVGTTSLRILESAADPRGRVAPFRDRTSIFITPGYRFRAVDLLMTNFHLPRSTLFMLVSAFSGLDVMKSAYAHALASGYRFYSFGDASLLERSDQRGA